MRLKINITCKFSRVLLIQNSAHKVIALDQHGCVYAVTPQPSDAWVNAGTVGTAQIICSPTPYEMHELAPIPIYQYRLDHLHALTGHRFAVHMSRCAPSDESDHLSGTCGSKYTISNLKLSDRTGFACKSLSQAMEGHSHSPCQTSTSLEVARHRSLSYSMTTNAKLVLSLSQKTCLRCTRFAGSACLQTHHNLHRLLRGLHCPDSSH